MSRTAKPSGRSPYVRQTDLRRRGARRMRSSFLILCEGLTEQKYFKGMPKRGSAIKASSPKCDHVNLIKRASSRRSEESEEYDEVWCVLDTELDPELTDKLLQEAKRGGVQLALSTPCFEVWLILHHAARTAAFQSADEAKKALARLLPTWTEADTKFSDFENGVEDACRRARDLDPSGEDHMENPSTSVWKLVEKLTHGS